MNIVDASSLFAYSKVDGLTVFTLDKKLNRILEELHSTVKILDRYFTSD